MFNHELLLAHNYKNQPFLYATEKVNGHRVCIFKQLGGELIGRTKSGNRVDVTKFHFSHLFKKLPTYTSIDCELYVPGRNSSYISTVLANGDVNNELQISVFAMPYLNGDRIFDMPLEKVAEYLAYYLLPMPEFFQCTNKSIDIADLLQMAIKKRIEGWVLKRGNYTNWYKLKPVKTLDAFVTGFVDGKPGKYFGKVGALTVSVGAWWIPKDRMKTKDEFKSFEIAHVSGMDNITRFQIERDCDMGRVCEVAYQGVGDKGRLQFPRFIQWRYDKKPSECLLDQDDDLVEYWSKSKC